MKSYFILLLLVLLSHTYAYPGNEDTRQEALMKLKNMRGPDMKTFPFENIQQHDDKTVVEKYLCPAEIDEDIADLEDASKYNYKLKSCLFKKTFQKNEDRICKKEVNFVFHKLMKRANNGNCGFESHHTLHALSYFDCGDLNTALTYFRNLLTQHSTKSYTTNSLLHYSYDICYDTIGKSVLWTSHRILTPQLFQNPYFRNLQSKIATEISTDSYFMQDGLFLTLKKRYEQEKHKSASNPGAFVMVPQPLVPPEHQALPLIKKSTHHYINMAPLWEQLVPLVTFIDEGIKQALLNLESKNPTSYNDFIILTTVTTLNKAETTSTEWFNLLLFKGNIWLKLVYQMKTQAAVLIVIHNTPGNPPPIENGCPVGNRKECNFQTRVKGEETDERTISDHTKYAFCCEVKTIDLKSIFNVNYKIDNYLKIDSFDTEIELLASKLKSNL